MNPPFSPIQRLRPGWQDELVKLGRLSASFCALGLFLPIISNFLDGYASYLEWFVDLASHWQWLFLAGLLLSCAVGLWQRQHWAWWLLVAPLPWLTASEHAPEIGHAASSTGQILTMVTANVHLGNEDISPLKRWLAQANPDLLVLQEVSPSYANQLDEMKTYPYRYLLPRQDPFGVAVLSRLPITHLSAVNDLDNLVHIEAVLEWQGQPLKLTAWHPMPPIAPKYHARRNEQLHVFAIAAEASSQPTILMGDLNATPWSSAFSGIAKVGLRRASGMTPTWPALGYGWLGIPIDHVMVNKYWAVVEHQTGPDIGSDHLPILVRVVLRSPG